MVVFALALLSTPLWLRQRVTIIDPFLTNFWMSKGAGLSPISAGFAQDSVLACAFLEVFAHLDFSIVGAGFSFFGFQFFHLFLFFISFFSIFFIIISFSFLPFFISFLLDFLTTQSKLSLLRSIVINLFSVLNDIIIIRTSFIIITFLSFSFIRVLRYQSHHPFLTWWKYILGLSGI